MLVIALSLTNTTPYKKSKKLKKEKKENMGGWDGFSLKPRQQRKLQRA
jgi:hypothetical protein